MNKLIYSSLILVLISLAVACGVFYTVNKKITAINTQLSKLEKLNLIPDGKGAQILAIPALVDALNAVDARLRTQEELTFKLSQTPSPTPQRHK